MSASLQVFCPSTSYIDELEARGRGRFSARYPSSSLLVVDVRGEIDATNARDLGRFVERHAKASVQLILDLSEVQFFGTRGFATLYFIDVTCSRNDVDWMIVAGREVRRVLDICDPDGILPVADHRKFALTRLQHLARSWNRRPFSE